MELFGHGNRIGKSGCPGIQIKDDEVRPVEVLEARQPGMERQRVLIDQVEQGCRIIYQRIRDLLAVLTRERHTRYPLWVVRGRALLPEMRCLLPCQAFR